MKRLLILAGVVVFAACGQSPNGLDTANEPLGSNVRSHSLIITEEPPTNPGTGTPGYWKNHPDAWPVEEITIGGVTYSKAVAIVEMGAPEKGDKTRTIFRALVAAKLNVLIDNDDSCIADVIAAADAWMATHGPVGSKVKGGGKNSPWRDGEGLYVQMDDYNNGLLCAPSRDSFE